MLKIGSSACVLGEKVRYDGGHKRSGFVAAHISKIYQLVPFCPEVGIGLPTPRPAIQLRGSEDEVRLVDSKTGTVDHTESMDAYFSKQKARIAHLDGYILAAKSPSCGMERIKVHDLNGNLLHRKGRGLFAEQLINAFPGLPVEEDGRLNDQGLRESFFTRVHAHAMFREMVLEDKSSVSLIEFHTRIKYLLLAYNPEVYQHLGPVIANVGNRPLDKVCEEYFITFMNALSKPTNRKKHTNVLMHIQGFFKRDLSPDHKQELTEEILKYRKGYVPLLAPLTLINHYLKLFPNDFLQKQAYLKPFPVELGLFA